MRIFSLSIHADYRCRHSGECCTADWDVPVELPIYRNLAEALTSGRIAAAVGADAFLTEPHLPEGAAAMLGRTGAGDCVFYHRDSRLCMVHRDLGEPALPATCRHFPRLAVRDWRGTFVTLSHFCPTAAATLFRDDEPLEIVESPPAFPPGDYDGLTVHPDAWPPMLHPRMLMDLEGYSAWERHMVSRCAAFDTPESSLATLRRDALLLRRWRPADGPLVDAVRALRRDAIAEPMPAGLTASLRSYADAVVCIPDELKPPPDEYDLEAAYVDHVAPVWAQMRRPVGRFLAAKAFASWTAYQGRGLLTIIQGLDCALALLRVEAARQCRDTGRVLAPEMMLEAFRAADFILNHLAVAEDLAHSWARVEKHC